MVNLVSPLGGVATCSPREIRSPLFQMKRNVANCFMGWLVLVMAHIIESYARAALLCRNVAKLTYLYCDDERGKNHSEIRVFWLPYSFALR